MTATLRALSALAMLTGALACAAQDSPGQHIDLGAPPASEALLDALRGGADAGPDLHVAFGLERITTVNGVVVASTRFDVPDVGHITAAQAQAMQAALGSLLVVRNGEVSTVPLPAGNQSLGTVIQNSLPNQSIQNLVTVNLATNSLALLRSLNAADQLRGLALPGGH